MKFIKLILLVALLFLIPECAAVSFGVQTFEGTDGITYARSGYPNSSIECNETLGYCENYKPAPLSARFYYDGRIYLGKDTDHYIGIQPVGIFYINYENPAEREQLIGLSSASMNVNDNVVTYSKGPIDIIFTNSYNRIKGDIIFPNALPVPTVDNPALCIVWEIVGHAGINTDDGERNDWWFEQAKAYLPLGDIQNNGSKELKKKIFRQNGNVYLVEGVGYSWASSEERTDSQFVIDPTVIYNGDDSWLGTSGTLLEHGDGNLRSPPNITTGLVSYWNPSTDISSGSLLYDICGDNDGTINGATWNVSVGLDFDGSNDYIEFTSDNSFNITDEQTWISNVYTNTLTGNQLIKRKYEGSGETIKGFYVQLYYDQIKSVVNDGVDGHRLDMLSIDSLVNIHEWENIAVMHNLSSNSTIYMNGVQVDDWSDSSAIGDINTNIDVWEGKLDIYNNWPFDGVIGAQYFYNVSLTNEQINETRDNYHATSAYREIDTAQDAGAGQVWKYVGILGTDAGANTTGLLQINGSSDNVSFSGWQEVGSFDIDDNIVIPAGLEYRYAKFRWYSNTTYQPETDIIENFVMVSPSGVFSSVWNTSLTSTGSSPSTNVKLPLESSGTYSFLVDWGDNTSDIIGAWDQDEVNHTYASEGEYTINITGEITGWRFSNGGDKLKILNITSWGNLKLGNSGSYFYGCSNLNVGATDNLNTSGMTTFYSAFRGCSGLITLDVSSWDVSSVTSMGYMFYGCSGLTSLDVSSWDVSSVTSMGYMFRYCSSLTSLGVSSWDVSYVIEMHYMFDGCSGLTSLDVSSWDVSSVTDMYSTFRGCSGLITLDVSSWDVSSVTSMGYMFYGCSGLTSLDVSSWDVSSVTDMYSTFRGCSGLITLDVSSWNVSSVTYMGSMFQSCSGLTTLDVSSWNVSSVTYMGSMFQSCSGLTTLDVSSWDVSSVTSMGYMFYGCSGLTSLDVSSWDVSSVTDMYSTFRGCSGLITLDVSSWDVSSVTKMGYMFYGCSGLTSLDVSGWDTSSVTSFAYIFDGCSGLTSLDVSGWDVTSLLDATNMFYGVTLETSYYDALLINWSQQSVNNGVVFGGGNSQYHEGEPQSARNDTLIGIYGWTITDGGMIPEIIPPTYSDAGHNSTAAGRPVQFSLTCNDNVALETQGQYIFSTNNTGEWVNSSAVNFTSTPEVATNDTTLNSTIGITIGYRWYISDNRNNTNSTPIYTLFTTEPTNNRMPLSLFIMWSIIMFVGSVFSFITTGPKAIVLSLVSTTIAYMNSKLIISGDVVQYFAGVSSTDTIVTGYRTIESAALSYVFLFIALVIAIVFIAHVINEVNYQLSPDLEVCVDE